MRIFFINVKPEKDLKMLPKTLSVNGKMTVTDVGGK
jgi:hypothetical protein